MAYAYRYLLDGNGPYESEKFDTEDAMAQAAEERGHTIETPIEFDSAGNASFGSREVIDLDKSNPEQENATPDEDDGNPVSTDEPTA
jgi:hypothetical protein